MHSSYSPVPLARGITVATIPSHGTGENLTDRQLRLILRLSLRGRYERASNLWDTKGRVAKPRRDFYEGLTSAELAEVGLQRVKEGGERRDVTSYRVRNFKVTDADWVAGWVWEQNVRDGIAANAAGDGYGVAVAEGEGGHGGVDSMDVEFVEGAETALALLGAQLNLPVEKNGRTRVLVVWLHSLDVEVEQDGLESIGSAESGGEVVDMGEKEEEEKHEEYHTRGLLLDTDQITVGKLLHQIDTLIIQEYPHDAWTSLKLCKVILGACDDDDLDEEHEHPDSEVPECLEIFVGYEYVGEKIARAARDAWQRDFWRQAPR
ncbi:hypothetical protein ONS95_003558 [Cadophora gregata]|uniref:uncharacterized protein n=1 Tax=Cadophora gregata TaxID=51156 RepID=UPI0026DD22E3|nr:uncharacterized protein ONS95_003558 [Cadophora gregata]KAK0106835.1 hypothetical protein ONS95_003558 [Cadophora gregata]